MNDDLPIISASVSDRGLSEKRRQNEDSFLELNRFGLYAVADGVGGAQGGEVASQMAMEILAEAFINRSEGADVEQVLRAAVERANTAIHQMAEELPQLWSMATTIVALHIAGNIATIGHVGDSRLYRVDSNGNLHRETDDHSMVADEVRAGRMTEEQAENHPSRNIISRALGAEPTVDAELKTMLIEPGNIFLICSDGITRHVNDEEIKELLTSGREPNSICEHLKSLCYDRGAEDNLTAVVVKAGTAPKRETSFDVEEPTVATARSPFESEVSEADEFPEPATTDDDAEYARVFTDTAEMPYPAEEDDPAETLSAATGGSSGYLSRVLTAVAMLVLGGLIGLGTYHYLLAPTLRKPDPPQLSEMKATNIPLSSFEETRRDVDKDPAGYITKFGASPRDSEDFYLLGRAYLLTRDYAKARTAFIASRDGLPEADAVNAKILASDIAVAMAAIDNVATQSTLTKELDTPVRPQPANTNTNGKR